MCIAPIYWEYIGKENCLWLGTTKGILSHIKFYITTKNNVSDEYFIDTNISGYTSQTVIAIENAKIKAQELLNSYAISIALL